MKVKHTEREGLRRLMMRKISKKEGKLRDCLTNKGCVARRFKAETKKKLPAKKTPTGGKQRGKKRFHGSPRVRNKNLSESEKKEVREAG